MATATRPATFDHVAHAARRIRDLLPLYRDQLGGTFLHGGVNERVGYRAVQLGLADDTKVELMEPLAGSTFLDSFFSRHPQGGLHHVTFRVADLAEHVVRARAAGLKVVGEHYEDSRWREAFVHPRSGHGALVQLVQAADGYPPAGLGGSLDQVLGLPTGAVSEGVPTA